MKARSGSFRKVTSACSTREGAPRCAFISRSIKKGQVIYQCTRTHMRVQAVRRRGGCSVVTIALPRMVHCRKGPLLFPLPGFVRPLVPKLSHLLPCMHGKASVLLPFCSAQRALLAKQNASKDSEGGESPRRPWRRRAVIYCAAERRKGLLIRTRTRSDPARVSLPVRIRHALFCACS